MSDVTEDHGEYLAHERRLRRFTWRVFLAVLALVLIALALALAGPGRDLYDVIDEKLNPPDAVLLTAW
jgi:hypothetical protein